MNPLYTELAVPFLKRLGYLDPGALGDAVAMAAAYPETAKSLVCGALLRFQRLARLPETGIVDPRTESFIHHAPLCGVSHLAARSEQARWGKRSLDYVIAEYVAGLSRGDQDDLFRQATSGWSAVADVRFRQVPEGSAADVVVNLMRPHEGRDGPGRVLAWATVGGPGPGRVAFDPSERWIPDLYLKAAAHELGHVLGLDHDGDPAEALMDPMLGRTAVPLAPDVARIVALYGVARPDVPPPPPEGGKSMDLGWVVDAIERAAYWLRVVSKLTVWTDADNKLVIVLDRVVAILRALPRPASAADVGDAAREALTTPPEGEDWIVDTMERVSIWLRDVASKINVHTDTDDKLASVLERATVSLRAVSVSRLVTAKDVGDAVREALTAAREGVK